MESRKIFSAVLSALLMTGAFTGCGSAKKEESDDEETSAQTLTVSDPDYYTRFKGKGISINVYNWGEYISDGADEGTLDVNREFEELTGIKVKVGMIQKLDFDNIPNFSYIMDNFRNLEYDPENDYSVPYTWGTVGIIYDTTMIDIPADEIDWDLLWNEDYADQILMFDNPRDAFAIAEIMQGYSLNTENPEELAAAARKLTEQKSIVQGYVMDEVFDKMEAGDALIAPYYAGDALTAEMYINFMCEPDIAYANIDYICYSTPHQAAYEMLDEDVQNSSISYPDDEFVANKTTVFVNLSDEANKTMQDLWTEMKSAEDDNSNRFFVPVFLIICIGIIAFVLIRRHVKNKKDIF